MSEHQDLVEKEVRVKQKLWARASARWMTAVRSSARRRRNRRRLAVAQVPSAQSSAVSLHDMVSAVTQSASVPSSPRPSTVRDPETRGDYSSHRLQSHNAGSAISLHSPMDPETSSPPAYIHGRSPISSPAKLDGSREAYSIDDESPHSLLPPDNEDQPEYPMPVFDDLMPYDASFHAAHVATDDKNLLARMAHMASAPPSTTDEGGSSQLVISAPVWDDDEEVLDGAIDDTHVDIHPASSPPCELPPSISSSGALFPPPPSKGKMAAPSFYDYPYSFEVEPEMEPSAPPFEEHGPNAPPLEDTAIVPSAPALLDEPSPSAPDWDGEEEDIGQGHDQDLDPPNQPSTSDPMAVDSPLPSYLA
jgi:hypothetical protein